MRLNDKQIKQVTTWIKCNARQYRTKDEDGVSYDYTVMAEACGNELFCHQGYYTQIEKETEYYAIEHS